MKNSEILLEPRERQSAHIGSDSGSRRAAQVLEIPRMGIPDGPAVRAYVQRAAAAPVSETAAEPLGPQVAMQAKKLSDEIMPKQRRDRRLLPHVPARSGIRTGKDRRGQAEIARGIERQVMNHSLPEHRGIRYDVIMPVKITCFPKSGIKQSFTAKCRNISTSGMQVTLDRDTDLRLMRNSQRIKVSFRLKPGMMPEGYETRYNLDARAVVGTTASDSGYNIGLAFNQTLDNHAYAHRGRWLLGLSAMGFVILISLIILLRVNSASLATIGRLAYIYSFITSAYLLTRYVFAAFYRATPVNPAFTPGVSIVVPCYDEEDWIQRTIIGCLDQVYPRENLEVIIVDDHSRDNSPKMIEQLLAELWQVDDLYDTKARVRYVRQAENLGKREAMARGMRMARHDLVVVVDSDSFLDPTAIMHLVQPFQDPKVGGVSGRTDVANSYTNVLTKMQAVKYYVSFRVLKAAEGYFNAVTCLSGPLSCYRKQALEENIDAWLNQQFFGRKATFGDDRSMTNFILRNYRTDYQDTAICSTIVPQKHRMFLRQQMRWKRSWLRETSIAAGYMWRKEPLMALSFYIGFLLPVLGPFIVLLNLIYMPLFQSVLPITFILGFLAMSTMMCFAQLLMRRSSIWLYGMLYNLYHIFVLVWQMPIAWFTFWKSTWGTRMTTSDLEARGIRTEPTPVQSRAGGQ
ncbi:MAG: glycosyltransferase [Christensenellales bacterium]